MSKLLLLLQFSLIPFKIGEVAEYEVYYGPFKAGIMRLEVVEITEIRGRPAYHFLLKAETKGAFSAFFKVADEIHSFVDTSTFATLRYEKHIREGKYRADRIVDYYPDSGFAVYPGGDTIKIPENALDPLAVFYYVRLNKLRENDLISVPYHVDKRSMTLKIRTGTVRTVKTPWGKLDALPVIPDFKGVSVFKSKRGMELLISPALRRIPLEIKTKLFIGSLTARILDYFPGY